MATSTAQRPMVTDEMLERFRSRAAGYDRENKFFKEDWDELKAAGFMTVLVPTDLGGAGWSLPEYCKQLQKIAEYAPGDRAGRQHAPVLGRASPPTCGASATSRWSGCCGRRPTGEVFAAGHAESGNDLPGLALDRQGRARGRRLPLLRPQDVRQPHAGVDALRHPRHGRSDPTARRSSTPSCRATRPATRSRRPGTRWACAPPRSDDTILDGAFVPDKYIGRVAAGRRARTRSSWPVRRGARQAFVNIYYGIAQRARDLARGHRARSARRSASAARWPTTRRSSTASPRWRWSSRRWVPQLDRIAQDWANGVDHGAEWPLKIVGDQVQRASRAPRRSWTCAMDMSGRHGHVQGERARAALPRRPLRRLPPGELAPGARDRRQDRPRHRPRRAAPLGLGATSPPIPGC